MIIPEWFFKPTILTAFHKKCRYDPAFYWNYLLLCLRFFLGLFLKCELDF
jgi:hypothetical protein